MSENTTILVVDDSRIQAIALRNLLQAHGYDVTVAADGKEALAVAQQQKPTLVISDIVMPVMDGYALCHALKQNTALCDIPVILLTSLSDTEDIIRGLEAQADYYLTKPYADDYLLATLKDLLENLTRQQSLSSIGNAAPGVDGGLNGLEITLAGKRHFITANRRQMLNLLLSTYGNAIQQNRDLTKTKQTLETLNQQLREQAQRIEEQQKELREANAQLHELATSDGLTGLKNHRAFKDKLLEEFQRALRYDAPLSLLLLDVDKFKQYNDAFGHPAGDEILKTIGRLLREARRDADFAARYGGEEFVVILPNTDAEAACVLAERLRVIIESAPWKERAITISAGAATISPAITDGNSLIEQADKALYHSKSSGRNCVTHARDLPGHNSVGMPASQDENDAS